MNRSIKPWPEWGGIGLELEWIRLGMTGMDRSGLESGLETFRGHFVPPKANSSQNGMELTTMMIREKSNESLLSLSS